MEPNSKLKIGLVPRMDSTIKPIAMTIETVISCDAACDALLLFPLPRYWEITTAPPVAIAANILIRRLLIISTSDTPDMAASPA